MEQKYIDFVKKIIEEGDCDFADSCYDCPFADEDIDVDIFEDSDIDCPIECDDMVEACEKFLTKYGKSSDFFVKSSKIKRY